MPNWPSRLGRNRPRSARAIFFLPGNVCQRSALAAGASNPEVASRAHTPTDTASLRIINENDAHRHTPYRPFARQPVQVRLRPGPARPAVTVRYAGPARTGLSRANCRVHSAARCARRHKTQARANSLSRRAVPRLTAQHRASPRRAARSRC